jgi:hypothetical protein
MVDGRMKSVRRMLTLLVTAMIAAACSGSTPTASPAASALPPGTYTSKVFGPQVTFTVPAGWAVPTDSTTYFQLAPAGSDVVGIHLFRDPVAASQDPACPESSEPGVGRTALELSTWIRGRPGLTVSAPKLVTVGGLHGTELGLAIADGWTASCSFANGLPTVPLFVGANGEYRWVVAGSERLRLDLLDVPGGGTLVVDVDAFDGSFYADLVAAATPIVASLRFAAS